MTTTVEASTVATLVTSLMETLRDEIHERQGPPNVISDDVARAEGALLALRCLRDLAPLPIGLESVAPCWALAHTAPEAAGGSPHTDQQILGWGWELHRRLSALTVIADELFSIDMHWSDHRFGASIVLDGLREMAGGTIGEATKLLLTELDLAT